MTKYIPSKDNANPVALPDGSGGSDDPSVSTGAAPTQKKARVAGQKNALRKLRKSGGSVIASPGGFPPPSGKGKQLPGGPRKSGVGMADVAQAGSSVPATPEDSDEAPVAE